MVEKFLTRFTQEKELFYVKLAQCGWIDADNCHATFHLYTVNALCPVHTPSSDWQLRFVYLSNDNEQIEIDIVQNDNL